LELGQRALEGVVMPPLATQFSGRSALITGHTGFKGSWLTIWLHQLGAQVSGYALAPPTEPSNFQVAGVRELLQHHYQADVLDAAALDRALDETRPEVIFHLAAQSLVRESYQDPRRTFAVNVQGTVELLDAVRRAGRPCVVVAVSSDKCYENREQLWGYREIDPLGGFDPYSASKGAMEIAAAAYRRSFFPPERIAEHGVKLATARAGNVLGGGDWARDRIVVDAVEHLQSGRPVPVRNPASVRPWQHVLEPLSGYLTLAARLLESNDPQWCEAWNFGPMPGDQATVRHLVELLIDAWGEGVWQDRSSPNAPHEAGLLRLSIDKAIHRLGWRPRWTLDETVRRTAAWYRRFYVDRPSCMLDACLADIDEYERSNAARS
ncbi:MAG: CDP-glucose 4,6-dehydratase, partial [Thermoguttaceae bacterium]